MNQSIMSKYFQQESTVSTPAVLSAGVIPEVDMGGVEQAAAAVVQNEFELNSLETTAHALDSIASFVTGTIGDGGMDRGTAAAISMAAASHLEPLGLHANMPATESFGGISDRITASNFACEAIKDDAKRIYKAVRDAIVKAIESVQKWFAELFNKVPGLIKKFEAIVEKADKTTGTIENKKITLSSAVADKLALGKTVDTGKFSDGIKAYNELTTQLTSTGAKAIADRISNIAKAAESVDVEDETKVLGAMGVIATEAADPFIKVPGKGTVDGSDFRLATKDQLDDPDFGLEVSVSEELLGGNAIFTLALKNSKQVAEIKSLKDLNKAASSIRSVAKGTQKMLPYTHKELKVEEQDIDTLDASTVSSLAQQVVDTLENIKKNVDNAKVIAKAKTDALKASDAVAKDIDASDTLEGEQRTSVKLMHSALQEAIKGSDSVANKITGSTVTMVNALGSVLTQSLSEHK